MTPNTPSRLRSLAVPVLKTAVATALVGWLVLTGRLDVGAYGNLMSTASVWPLASIAALLACTYLLFIARWKGLALVQGIPLSWAEVIGTGLRGLFTQLFVPGGIGADGVRILHLRRWHGDRLTAGISSLVVDRVTGVLGVALVSCVAGTVYVAASTTDAMGPLLLLNLGMLGFATVTVLALVLLVATPIPLPERIGRHVASARSAVRRYMHARGAVFTAVLISGAGNIATALAACLCLLALGYEVTSVIGVISITCLLNILRMVPITPMGLGVTDTAAEGLYQLIGLPVGAELQMLMRLISIALFLCAGLAFYWQPEVGRSHES